MTKLSVGLNDSFVLSGLLESAPLVGGYTRNLPFCWLSFLPMLGGPWKVHLSTHLECVGRRVHHAATYIWRRGLRDSSPKEAVGVTVPQEPAARGGGRLSGSFVG